VSELVLDTLQREVRDLEFESFEQLMCLREGQPAFVGLVVEQPEAKARKLVAEKVSAKCLFVRGSDLVQVDLLKFIEVKAPLHLSEVALERVDHLSQVVRVDRHIEGEHFRVFSVELRKFAMVNFVGLMVLHTSQ